MTSMIPNKRTTAVPVKVKGVDNSLTPSEPTKDESRSFLSFSRENLSISHSDLEQGFNRTKHRVRRDTVLSLVAIILALCCVGIQIWKIQGMVDNAREIDVLKREVESMKHRLLEQDLLDELKAFEEQMYAEEGAEDEEDSEVDGDDYDDDSVYDDDDEEDGDGEKAVPPLPEYQGDYHAAPYTTHASGSGDRGDKFDDVLAALHKAEALRSREFEKSVRDNRKSIERERLLDEDELKPGSEKHKDQEEIEEDKEEEADVLKKLYKKADSSVIVRKRSIEDDGPVGYNPSGVPIYAHSYLIRNKKNFTRNSPTPRLSLYESLTKAERQVTTEKSDEEPAIHHAMITSWEKHPPKKYYAQSRPATAHVTPPAFYASGIHRPRQMESSRLGDWGEEGPQALTMKESVVSRKDQERKISKVSQEASRPLRRRGMTRRHLRGTRQVVAAHYAADSTRFSAEDEHVGNGKGRHHQGVFKAWRASDWMSDLGMTRHFALANDGQLTVQDPGLYLVYAQIHYLDQHDENGFQVLVNEQPILQCMVYSPGTEHKSRSCFSAQATLLQSGDHLVLRDVGLDRYTLFQQDKSFFGLFKLGDTRALRQQTLN